MMTYSPVTTAARKSPRDEFDALWTTYQPANWAMPSLPDYPPQEMLLELLWKRDLESSEDYFGVPI